MPKASEITERINIVEFHGKQHYELTNYSDAEAILTRTQRNDVPKGEYAKTHFHGFYIIDTRVDCTYDQMRSRPLGYLGVT